MSTSRNDRYLKAVRQARGPRPRTPVRSCGLNPGCSPIMSRLGGWAASGSSWRRRRSRKPRPRGYREIPGDLGDGALPPVGGFDAAHGVGHPGDAGPPGADVVDALVEVAFVVAAGVLGEFGEVGVEVRIGGTVEVAFGSSLSDTGLLSVGAGGSPVRTVPPWNPVVGAGDRAGAVAHAECASSTDSGGSGGAAGDSARMS